MWRMKTCTSQTCTPLIKRHWGRLQGASPRCQRIAQSFLGAISFQPQAPHSHTIHTMIALFLDYSLTPARKKTSHAWYCMLDGLVRCDLRGPSGRFEFDLTHWARKSFWLTWKIFKFLGTQWISNLSVDASVCQKFCFRRAFPNFCWWEPGCTVCEIFPRVRITILSVNPCCVQAEILAMQSILVYVRWATYEKDARIPEEL